MKVEMLYDLGSQAAKLRLYSFVKACACYLLLKSSCSCGSVAALSILLQKCVGS